MKKRAKKGRKGYTDRFPASVLKGETRADYHGPIGRQEHPRQMAKGMAIQNLTTRLRGIGRAKIKPISTGSDKNGTSPDWRISRAKMEIQKRKALRIAKKYGIQTYIDEEERYGLK